MFKLQFLYFLILYKIPFNLGVNIKPEFATSPDVVNVGKPFNLTCKLLQTDIVTIMSIAKMLPGSTDIKKAERYVHAYYSTKGEQLDVLPKYKSRVKPFGTLGEKYITAGYSSAECNDTGTYLCKVTFIVLTRDYMNHSTIDLQVEVPPEKISLQSEPSNSVYAVGSILKLTCKAIVGTVMKDEKVKWSWEYKSMTDDAWKTYGDESSITAGETELKPCYQEQTSILTHKVIVEDHMREYRCLFTVGTDRYESLAANFTIKTDKGFPDDDADGADGGTSAGTIAIALVGIVLLVGLAGGVYVMVTRRNKPAAAAIQSMPGNAQSVTDTAGSKTGIAGSKQDIAGSKLDIAESEPTAAEIEPKAADSNVDTGDASEEDPGVAQEQPSAAASEG